MKGNWARCCAIAATLALPYAAGAAAAPKGASAGKSPGKQQLERGRYVVMIGGCNDCHTDGYAPSGGKVPEKDWLLGSGPLGFRGPWGTTYAPNLRLTASTMTEADWVKYAKTLRTRPPMPWFNVNAMSEGDLRAMYRFIGSLGPVGSPAQAYVPPDKQPNPPYIQWPAPPKSQ
jgi:mono/diheme cytochrome c family protein